MRPGTIELEQNLNAVRERIARACGRAGRSADAVRLVAVSKTFPAERVNDMVAAGHTLFGENRVQEALDKMPAVTGEVRWHLVGHLQRNKARHAVGRFELIHSVDGDALARELDRRAASAGVVQAVLVQVNLSGETTKSGVDAAGLPALLETTAALEHLDLRGLMTLPPPAPNPDKARHWFTDLRRCRDEAQDRLGRPLPDLSMGMTDDFEVAVEEGATLVRVGRALFGERPR